MLALSATAREVFLVVFCAVWQLFWQVANVRVLLLAAICVKVCYVCDTECRSSVLTLLYMNSKNGGF